MKPTLRADLFADLSRRPHSSPKRSAAPLEARVVQLRQKHPTWGGRKLATVLRREGQGVLAASTATEIIRRHGMIDPAASQAATPWQRFEHPHPNALWQIDFKGHFAIDTGRCHPLTVLDDHSRYNLVLAACDNERGQTVKSLMQEAFRRYGLPLRINADNGAPWGNQGDPFLTQMALWWIRLGINVSFSRPLHPQTNGKEERFHRTLKAELIAGHRFTSIAHVQERFDQWRPIYNSYRPHEAIGLATPASRFTVSPRLFPETLPDIVYSPSDQVRRVQSGGLISFKGNLVRVGSALHGLPVALRQNRSDGRYDIYFCHKKILSLDPTGKSATRPQRNPSFPQNPDASSS